MALLGEPFTGWIMLFKSLSPQKDIKMIMENYDLDTCPILGHNRAMEHIFMVQSTKHPLVYFRNERARFWADNTVLCGESATEYVAKQAEKKEQKYLIFHPEEDDDDSRVPFDFDGWIIRFGTEVTENSSN